MSSRSRWDAEKLMQFMTAYQPPVVLAAAMDLDLFEHLATKPCSSEELARRAGFNPRGTRILLDALAGLDLLEKNDGQYSVPEELSALLVSREPGSMRAMARHHADMVRSWLMLPLSPADTC